MPDVKISALPAAGALTGTEPVPIVQSAATKITTCQDIANLAPAVPVNPVVISAAGQYIIATTTAAYQLAIFDDNGSLTVETHNTLEFRSKIGGVTEWDLIAITGSITETVLNGAVRYLSLNSGGQMLWNDATNSYAESGFTSTSHQVTGLTAGYWGGAGTPALVEHAIERLAAAVSGLLGGGIP